MPASHQSTSHVIGGTLLQSVKIVFSCGFLLWVLFSVFLFPASAADPSVPQEYRDLSDCLPDEITEQLPDELFSNDTERLGEAVEEISSPSFFAKTLLSLFGNSLKDTVSKFAILFAILLLSAIARSFENSFQNGKGNSAFAFLTTLCILILFLREGFFDLENTLDGFSTLSKLSEATLPVTGILYAMGGNIRTATVSTAGLSFYLTFVEEIITKTVPLICGICIALSVLRAVDPGLRTDALAKTVKKHYTTILSALTLLLLAVLTAQTTLEISKDSVTMKGVKIAVSNLIPVIGGSVADLFRSVSAGIGYLRGTLGISAVLLMILSLLPPLIRLLLARTVYSFASSIAALLHCDRESGLLDDLASLCGILAACLSVCSSVPLLSLSLLIHNATAVVT